MKRILAYVTSLGFTAAATLLVILATELIGVRAFGGGFLTWLEVSICLTVLSWAFYYPIAIGVYVAAGLKEPGVLLITMIATITGTLATWALAYLWPDAVTLGFSLIAVIFAFAVTMVVWGLAFGTGKVRKDLSLMPKRK